MIALDNKSAQLTTFTNMNTSAQLKPNELEGRVRLARFYFKPTAAVAAGDNVGLCRLPKGARIVEIIATSNAFVATADLQIGLVAEDGTGEIDDSATADNTTMFGTGLDVATAGAYAFADTQAKNYGYELVKDCYLTAELVTAGMDGSADVLAGHCLYVID